MSYESGTIGRVFYVRWKEPPTPAALREILQQLAVAHARAKERVICLSIADRLEQPAPETREAFRGFVTEMRKYSEFGHLVLPLEGFKGSIVRSMITGVLLMTGATKEVCISTSVPGALEEMSRRHGLSLADLRQQARARGLTN